MCFYLDCVVTLLLLPFSLSTAVPRCLLGIARLNPVTLSKFGATCNKRKTLHQSSCTCGEKKKRKVEGSEADKSTWRNSARRR